MRVLTDVQPTGKESLVERWILHKLNAASAEVNKQLEVRNFMAATNVLYNFWLYELCDVYIVRLAYFSTDAYILLILLVVNRKR